ncbi:MAG: aminoacyl-tRNA hydrolase [Acidobacteria bacterium]|nr:aminoacyl-tRNA hydrolase [Acidobacteriota bacterium]
MRRLFSGSGPADWLIVGLGNPGPAYAWTPHNVGWLVLEELVRRWDLGRARTAFDGRLVRGRVGDPGGERVEVALLAPLTYMNESGRSAGPARGALKVELDHVLAVHDEIDLPFGEVRARVGGGLAGHNGLKSLKRGLGGDGFSRLRVGVGRPDSTDREVVSAYVLGRWQQDDDQVGELVSRAADEAERVVFEGLPAPDGA